MLSWWSNIDTLEHDDEPSLYESLFLNKTVTNPPEAIFALNEAGDELAESDLHIEDHFPAVRRALGVNANELQLLVSGELTSLGEPPPRREAIHAVNLANLSALYRAISLARSLGLSIQDFLTLRSLSNEDPFGSPVRAHRFADAVERVRSSGFGVAELNYLLAHRAPPNAPVTPGDDQIAHSLTELTSGLRQIAGEPRAVSDPTGERTAQALTEWLPEAEAQRALALLDGSSEESIEDREAFIEDFFAEFLDPDEARRKLLVDAERPTDSVDRFNYVLLPMLSSLAQRSFAKQKLADVLGLDLEITESLLDAYPARSDPRKKAILDFVAVEFVGSDVGAMTPERFPIQFEQFRLLEKISRILTKFQFSFAAMKRLFPQPPPRDWDGPGMGWLDLTALPIEPAAPEDTTARFEAWSRMAEMVRLRETLPGGEPALLALLDIPHDPEKTEADFRASLSESTGWREEDLASLMGDAGFGLAFPDDYRNEGAVEQLKRLKRAFDLIKRLGVSAAEILPWRNHALSVAQARGIKQAVRSRYDEAHWLQVAQPLRDELREKQRAALVAHLLGRNKWKDTDDLYQEFLIDVEMSPCMMTSRIKQVISSVQLFVQRALMGLERDRGVALDEEEAAREWKWMKNYRVWEANRKVFLYPENWIEPELRDDKSPFFKELEDELLQSDVTQESAETALLHYLAKLNDVSGLEMAGMYREIDIDERGHLHKIVLHVFGRTRSAPHIYYNRRQEAFGEVLGSWTPWETVDIDIEGDHLVPVVWNQRLYLFWPIFTEKANAEIPGRNQEGRKPQKFWEIQIAWSEYRNKKWSAKKVSEDRIEVRDFHPKSDFRLKARIEDDGLFVFYEFEADNFNDYKHLYVHNSHFHVWWGGEVFDGRDDFRSRVELGFKLGGSDGNTMPAGHFFPLHQFPFQVTPNSNLQFNAFKESVRGRPDPLILIRGELVRDGFLNQDTKRYKHLLLKTPGHFRILYPHEFRDYFSQEAVFYEDNTRTFFVLPMTAYVGPTIYRFYSFYHPYIREFITQLNRHGIDGVLDPDAASPNGLYRQGATQTFFREEYIPSNLVDEHYPKDEIDFSPGGAYSGYNWELFFHAPLLIADRLSKNQRFEEAQRWFHYMFDPTAGSSEPGRERYWKTRPFYEAASVRPIVDELWQLLDPQGDPERKRLFKGQVDQWRASPFNPHLIARLRDMAYPKTVVMKYLDNLIGWGDQLFRRDTIESINEAAQLYLLAGEILGARPVAIERRDTVKAKTYSQLQPDLDALGNAVVQIELVLPAAQTERFNKENYVDPHLVNLSAPVEQEKPRLTGTKTHPPVTLATTLYFCIPPNDKLLGYWDTVADRLFKIRHCLNIEGVARQLPLFEPPIDPALLVRAAAAGVDIGSALNDLVAPLPHYRFEVMLQKALELCADVRGLGGAFLSVLEKRDAEGLALLRSSQEIRLLDAIRQVKEEHVKDAEEAIEALRKSKEAFDKRREYYESREYMNVQEKDHLEKLAAAHGREEDAQAYQIAASAAHLLPTLDVGMAGWASSPLFKVGYGGLNVGTALQAVSQFMQRKASSETYKANRASIKGGFDRRRDDWKFQAEQASAEIKQIDKQILSAQIRLKIAENELENHDLQTENANDVAEYMRDKFTNEQLYNWMVSQISTVYFQSYQMAYDLAKRVERTFRHELGMSDSSFIQFGYWDSLKKGLLAGEKLHYDLKRMDVSYLEHNRREYEITKHVSMAMLDPVALMNLKQRGECFVNLPEAIFDLDDPGHYMRRIKSAGLTIPCVTGPYTGVNCTLTLLRNSIRKDATLSNEKYGRLEDQEDPRFVDDLVVTQSIVTSSGQSDSGLFEVNLRDERYLPFEGAGAISEWRVQLPDRFRQFDYDTISDVILHLRYTAREGGQSLGDQAVRELQEGILNNLDLGGGRSGLFRAFSARHEFPGEWSRFLTPTGDQTLELKLTPDQFPFLFRGMQIRITQMKLFLKLKEGVETEPGVDIELALTPAAGEPVLMRLNPDPTLGGLFHGETPVLEVPWGSWSLSLQNVPIEGNRLDPDKIEDIMIVVHYSVAAVPS